MSSIVFRFLGLIVLLTCIRSCWPSPQHLLLIVLDGYRSDYIDRQDLPGGLAALRSKGTSASHLIPVTPSLTFPNLNSLITGLYPESHGFVANVMYDPTQKTVFESPEEPPGSESYWWNVSTPIWATATRNNVTTGMYGWPRCNVKIMDHLPEYCIDHVQYQELALSGRHLAEILLRFQRNELQFAMVYVEYPDIMGHANGPDSKEMTKALANVDQLFVDLVDQLNDMKDTDINIIVTSDHGMIDIASNASSHVPLSDYLNVDDVSMVTGAGTTVGVYPIAARFVNVYDDLKRMDFVKVMKKQDIPDEYHLKLSDRTAPIVLMANPGYYMLPLLNTEKQKPSISDNAQYISIHKGVHGYDPAQVPQMNGIFILYGPAFNRSYYTKQIRIVDVYNLMTCVLDIKGQPNNGSWDHVCPFLNSNCSGHCHPTSAATNRTAKLLLICIAFFVTILQLLGRI